MIHSGFLSSSERRELEVCLRNLTGVHGVALRANSILFLDDGKSCRATAEFLYLDDDTIRGWHRTYRQSGWDAAFTESGKRGHSRMAPTQEAELCPWMDIRFCRSTVEIRAHFVAQYGVDYSHACCINLLARLGYEYRKSKGLPRVAPAERQAKVIAMYEHLFNGLGNDEAVHRKYQAKPSYGWVKAGSNPAVTTTAGRGGVSVYRALNLEIFDAPFVEPITVYGASAVQLLDKTKERSLTRVPLDNAAYYKGPDVRASIASSECRIYLIQLPLYCAHLNLIERLSAVMYQFVTHNGHYQAQKKFANAILMFFRETIPNEWKTFGSQVTENFKLVTHEKFRVSQ